MVSRLIRACLDAPALVLLAALVIAGGGWWALRDMPVDAIPDIGEKQVIVFADWPGRSPQDCEDQLTYPLTVGLTGTPGVKSIRSMSGFGFGMVFLAFREEVDYPWARSRVLERLDIAQERLPEGVVARLGPDATALGQILEYKVVGDGFDLAELRAIQDWLLRYPLNAVEGVSEVASIGGYVKEYQVDLDPERMRAHGVGFGEIDAALRGSNLDVGAQAVERNGVEYFVRGTGFLRSIADLEAIVVRESGGVPLRVKDVATVQLGPQFRRGALDDAGVEAVGGIVAMRVGENPREVLQRVLRRLREIEPGLPTKTLADGTVSRVRVVPFYDRSVIIDETIGTLKEALSEELVAVALVVFLFLLHLRASAAILVTMPLALALSFLGMRALGVDANIMSMAGLAIAIGDVSDMGIIMCENIFRRLAQAPSGKPRREVVHEAASEVGGAILAAVSNTVVSFLPVFALTAEEGKLFKPLAWTKTFAIASSAILAVTIVPVLCLFLLRELRIRRTTAAALALPGGAAAAAIVHWLLPAELLPEGRLAGWPTALGVGVMAAAALYAALRERLRPAEENPVSRAIAAVYAPLLRLVLRFKAAFLTLPLAIVLLGLTIWLGFDRVFGPLLRLADRAGIAVSTSAPAVALGHALPGLGREFMPPLDEGSFLFMPSLLPAASLTQALDVVATQDRALAAVPEVASVVGKIGRSESPLDPAPIGMIETILLLKPEREWRRVREERFWSGWPRVSHDLMRRLFPDERPLSKDELLRELQEASAIPGVLPTWLQPIQTRLVMLQTGFRAMMGVKIFGRSLPELEAVAARMERLLRQVPGAVDVVADRIVGKPYVEIAIDREALGRHGLLVADVQAVVQQAIGGETVTTTVEGRERYPVRLRFPRERREQIEALEHVLVSARNGAQVPLASVAEVKVVVGPSEIKSENGQLVAYVTMNTRGRDEVSVVEDAERVLRAGAADGTLALPPGTWWQWAGQFENQVRSTRRLALLVPLCLALDFLLLYVAFRRGWVALLCFSAIAVSACGGFLMLLGWGFNLSVAVWVGFIALFGVAEDDAVVMATYLGQLFRERSPRTVAEVRATVVEAGLKRIRPCLMTTATTVIGLIPVFAAHGRGADVMQPMALPSIGGMAVQLVTLFITPCVWCMVEERRLRRRAATEGTAP